VVAGWWLVSVDRMTTATPSSTPSHADLAASLLAARRDRRPIEPLSTAHPELRPTDAYAIQQHVVAGLLDELGGHIVGHKLGLTSAPMQELLGVDEPDYGPVLSSMVHDDGAALDTEAFLQPKVEAEIALVLDAPLAGPGVTVIDAQRAIAGAVAALELVDSRIADWRITLVDTIADLASSAAIVLGSRLVPLDQLDPRLTGMTVRRNGTTEATGAGAAALGDPVAAVAWLANTLAPLGVRLEPGHVIMTGALHAAFPVVRGDRIEATFDHLGSVRCRFV
jgi:2-keto-4-pentenoate hydratase